MRTSIFNGFPSLFLPSCTCNDNVKTSNRRKEIKCSPSSRVKKRYGIVFRIEKKEKQIRLIWMIQWTYLFQFSSQTVDFERLPWKLQSPTDYFFSIFISNTHIHDKMNKNWWKEVFVLLVAIDASLYTHNYSVCHAMLLRWITSSFFHNMWWLVVVTFTIIFLHTNYVHHLSTSDFE